MKTKEYIDELTKKIDKDMKKLSDIKLSKREELNINTYAGYDVSDKDYFYISDGLNMISLDRLSAYLLKELLDEYFYKLDREV